MGTYPSMAPEIKQERAHRGKAVDIYCIGCLFIELFDGELMWPGEGPAAFSRHSPGKVQVPGFSDDDTYCAVVTMQGSKRSWCEHKPHQVFLDSVKRFSEVFILN